jgi:hypothetical protein
MECLTWFFDFVLDYSGMLLSVIVYVFVKSM